MKHLDEFIDYLKLEKNYSEYTIKNYYLDINDYILYCNKKRPEPLVDNAKRPGNIAL